MVHILRNRSETEQQINPSYDTLAAALGELVRVQGLVNEARSERLQPTPDNVATYGLALIHEVGELQDELGWKPWKVRGEIDPDAAAEEFADVLAFLGMLTTYMVRRGVSYETIADAYGRKSAQNLLNCRAEGEQEVMRECEKCGTLMSVDFFGKSRNGGPTNWCLRCLRKYRDEMPKHGRRS